jgi:hypothetical protein
MKSCPTCHRTYADDTLTFCLVDGAILSAPFDPKATLQMPAARSTNPPPAQVLPPSAALNRPAQPRRNPLLIIIAIVGGVVLVGGVILFLALNRTAPSSSNISSSPTTTDAAPSSPTATYNVAYEAMKNKDAAAFKKVITKKDLHDVEEMAKRDGKSSDDVLKALMNAIPLPKSGDSKDEKINGDTATLQVKNDKGEWEKINFVKEDGEWKMK